MKKRVFRTTKGQRATIEKLHVLLGEKGYLIYEVSPRYRRHRLDFIACNKTWQYHFVIVRPTPGGRVSMTSFVKKSSFPEIPRDFIRTANLPVIVWWCGQLLKTPSGISGWKKYFATNAKKKRKESRPKVRRKIAA